MKRLFKTIVNYILKVMKFNRIYNCGSLQITLYCISLRKLAHAINTDFFSAVKLEMSMEKNDIFNIFAQDIGCGYTLEPPR